MRVISKSALLKFAKRYPDGKDAALAWHAEVKREDWDQPAAVKRRYPLCSLIKGNRVVFNIKGNNYRIVVCINYKYRVVYIRFAGSHKEYDAIDVEKI
jgi:mRNA interferase HigB